MASREPNHFDEHVRRLTSERTSGQMEPDRVLVFMAGGGAPLVGLLILAGFAYFATQALDSWSDGGHDIYLWIAGACALLALIAFVSSLIAWLRARNYLESIKRDKVEYERQREMTLLTQRPSHVAVLAGVEAQRHVASGQLGAAEADMIIRLFEIVQVGKEGNLSREHEVRMERIRNSASLREAREKARHEQKTLRMRLQNERVPASIKTEEEKIRVDATIDLLARLDSVAKTNPTLGERLFNLWQRGAL